VACGGFSLVRGNEYGGPQPTPGETGETEATPREEATPEREVIKKKKNYFLLKETSVPGNAFIFTSLTFVRDSAAIQINFALKI